MKKVKSRLVVPGWVAQPASSRTTATKTVKPSPTTEILPDRKPVAKVQLRLTAAGKHVTRKPEHRSRAGLEAGALLGFGCACFMGCWRGSAVR